MTRLIMSRETTVMATAMTICKGRPMLKSRLHTMSMTRYMVLTTAPAAIGTGRPTKSMLWFSFLGAAAMQLKRARRKAAHSR